jgi:hypothetical protein
VVASGLTAKKESLLLAWRTIWVGPRGCLMQRLSPDTFLYCQDVDGATDKAERSIGLEMEGTEIILPSPATGHAVVAWDDTTMVWLNHRDASLYLLKRR